MGFSFASYIVNAAKRAYLETQNSLVENGELCSSHPAFVILMSSYHPLPYNPLNGVYGSRYIIITSV
jgi:hypothetical protein